MTENRKNRFNSETAKAARLLSSSRGPDKKKKELLEKIEDKYPGWNAVMAMIEIANDLSVDIAIRLNAMKAVAAYTNQQLKAVEHSGNIDSIQIITVEIYRENAKDQNT